MPRRLTHEEASARIAEYTGGDFLPNPEWTYVNTSTRIPGECLVCGNKDCAPRLNRLQQGEGHCRLCGDAKIGDHKRYSHTEAEVLVAQYTNGRFQPDPGWVYEAIDGQIPGICLECGADDCQPRLSSLQQGQGHCATCGHRRSTEITRIGQEDAARLVERYTGGRFHPDPSWTHRSNKDPIPGTCLDCGYTNCRPRLNALQQGQGHCHQCGFAKSADQRRSTQVEAEVLLNRHTNGRFLPDPDWYYTSQRDPIPGACLDCGNLQCSPTLGNLIIGIGHCVPCGHLKTAAKRRLSQEEVEARIKQANGGDFLPNPGWVYTNSATPIPGSCRKCGNMYCGPTLSALTSGQGHCSRCAVRFDFGAPSLLYLLEHPEERLIKVGVTNIGKNRIEQFSGLGWIRLEDICFATGRECLMTEQSIHTGLRSLFDVCFSDEDPLQLEMVQLRRNRAAWRLNGQSEMYPFEVFDGDLPATFEDLEVLLAVLLVGT